MTMSAILTLTCILITCVIYYFHKSFSYWKNKNVPFIKPSFPLGNIDLAFPKTAWKVTENLYRIFKKTGAKYGGIYMGPSPVFMPIHPDFIKEIIAKQSEYFLDRGVYYDEELDPLSAHLFSLSGQKWKSMRQKLSPTFTSGKIKMMFPILMACSENLKNVLLNIKDDKVPLDLKEFGASFTTDVIASCAFGIECNSLQNPNEDFRKYGRIFIDNNFWDKLKLITGFMAPSILKIFKIPFIKPEVSAYVTSIVKNNMNHREKNNIQRKDFFDLLIRIKNKENISDDDFLSNDKRPQIQGDAEGITSAQIAAQAFVFYVAGFETSSTTMSFCLLELAENHDIQEKLRDEINDVIKKHNGELTYEAVMEMKYLDCVIQETLRKYPVIYMLNRICTKDYQIENTDVTIEKGTRVIIPVYGLQNDSEYYSNPDIFDPNRFTQEEIEKRHPYTFLPFGEGPRFCIGMRFGLLQTKIGIITIIRNKKISIHEKTKRPIELIANIVILATKDVLYFKAENV